jgi:hypothetical protein
MPIETAQRLADVLRDDWLAGSAHVNRKPSGEAAARLSAGSMICRKLNDAEMAGITTPSLSA